MFGPFTLPSNPEVTIELRIATVQETIEFSSVMLEHEEALTTLFLNTVQKPDSYRDCRDWTADDRRFALFWYYLHTRKDTGVSLPYECPHCNESHVHNFNLRELAEHYQAVKGKSFRDVDFAGMGYRVAPLNGHALEKLEGLRLVLSEMEEGTPAFEQQRSEIRFHEVLYKLSNRKDFEKSPYKREQALKNTLLAMPESEFSELAALVSDAVDDMKHGLNTEIAEGQVLLVSPSDQCPTLQQQGKEVATVLHLPFRDYHYIPRI